MQLLIQVSAQPKVSSEFCDNEIVIHCRLGAINMRLVSWNVNGIRAAIRKGIDGYFSSIDADIWMLQEVRALPEQLPI